MDDDKTQVVNPENSSDQEPTTYDADYVKKLRAQSAEYRTKAKTLETRLAELENARAQSEQASLAEQGKFKELYEKSAAELKALQAERDALALTSLRMRVGTEAGLPPALIDRLKGTTEDELKADAEALKAVIPTQPATPGARQQTTTAVPGGTSPGMSDAELRSKYLSGGRSSPVFGD